MSSNENLEKALWISIRQGLITMIRAIERRYGLKRAYFADPYNQTDNEVNHERESIGSA